MTVYEKPIKQPDNPGFRLDGIRLGSSPEEWNTCDFMLKKEFLPIVEAAIDPDVTYKQ